MPRTLRIVLKPAANTDEDEEVTTESRAVELENGEDVLDMTLPETMTLMQLLDLAGEYLGLDYIYDTDEFSKQSVTLKLHGGLQGEMKVRDLYTLLETVLKFNLNYLQQMLELETVLYRCLRDFQEIYRATCKVYLHSSDVLNDLK